jgi:phage I-like protein
VIRLSRAEVETAKSLGMTEKEYAANKMALQKEGRMNKGA